MKMKRSKLLPNYCSRCGNDLITGRALLHLPFTGVYIAFCNVCSVGLKLDTIYQKTEPTQDQWTKFWDQEVVVKGKMEENHE